MLTYQATLSRWHRLSCCLEGHRMLSWVAFTKTKYGRCHTDCWWQKLWLCHHRRACYTGWREGRWCPRRTHCNRALALVAHDGDSWLWGCCIWSCGCHHYRLPGRLMTWNSILDRQRLSVRWSSSPGLIHWSSSPRIRCIALFGINALLIWTRWSCPPLCRRLGWWLGLRARLHTRNWHMNLWCYQSSWCPTLWSRQALRFADSGNGWFPHSWCAPRGGTCHCCCRRSPGNMRHKGMLMWHSRHDHRRPWHLSMPHHGVCSETIAWHSPTRTKAWWKLIWKWHRYHSPSCRGYWWHVGQRFSRLMLQKQEHIFSTYHITW